MATQCMEFKTEKSGIDFSEASLKTITIVAWDSIHTLNISLNEKNIIELRKWLSKQLREMKKPK